MQPEPYPKEDIPLLPMKDNPVTAITEVMKKAGTQHWVLITVGAIIIAFLAGFTFLTLNRFKKGEEVSLFGIKIKSDKVLEAQKVAFDNLNEDAAQKTQALKVLNQVAIEVVKAFNSQSYEEFQKQRQEIYNYLLYMIGQVLNNKKSASHRVAIFIDSGGGYLKVHEGVGYSTEGKKLLRLDISNSAAGAVYRTGEPYITGNVENSGSSYKPHPKATKKIKSLLCVPINCDNIRLGILSIDDQGEDTFTKDDMDYLTYFANALSSLMLIERRLQGQEGDTYEQAGSSEEQPA